MYSPICVFLLAIQGILSHFSNLELSEYTIPTNSFWYSVEICIIAFPNVIIGLQFFS